MAYCAEKPVELLAGETEVLGENLPQCRFVHHKLHMLYQILKKIIKPPNALAVNLLDNSETTHRLKMYTVLTLPDRPEQDPNTRIKVIPYLLTYLRS
jgi:hypothetical protein